MFVQSDNAFYDLNICLVELNLESFLILSYLSFTIFFKKYKFSAVKCFKKLKNVKSALLKL